MSLRVCVFVCACVCHQCVYVYVYVYLCVCMCMLLIVYLLCLNRRQRPSVTPETFCEDKSLKCQTCTLKDDGLKIVT